uniref:ATP-binding cassette sub-family C member 9-like n=1 Tax=Saccoglossus kowalevskii TaxID=10224 RepID=A0ABM0MLS3_SACKO|nr:PREDICTED: ATP-binding cassette sub-family C member 9-like [Saccoglossus kowalevskii]
MEWFCGRSNTTDVIEDVIWNHEFTLNNACFVDLVNAAINLFYLVAASIVLIVLSCFTTLRHYFSNILLQFPGHDVRWTLSIVLWCVLLCALGEGILTDLSRDGPTQPHLYIPQALAFLNGFIFLVYYHHMEYWNRPHLVWLLLLYWILLIGGQVITLINLDYQGATGLEVLRFDIAIVLLAMYFIYAIMEFNVIRAKIFGWFYADEILQRDLRKGNLRFVHDYTSLMSRTTFHWLNWLLKIGYKRPIEVGDLGALPEKHGDIYQYGCFLKAYEKERVRATTKGVIPSLLRTQWNAYGSDLILSATLQLVSSLLGFIAPVALGGVVTYATTLYYNLEPSHESTNYYITVSSFFSNGFVLVTIMFISTTLKSLTLQYATYIQTIKGMHVRTALQNHVYEKSMRLSSWTMTSGDMTMGLITNHMSVDAISFYWWYLFINYLWTVPFQIIVLLVLLYNELGYAALIGASVFLIVVPIQLKVGGYMSAAQKQVLQNADDRLKKSNELLQGMKLLKLYGWEEIFCLAIEQVRKKEMKKMLKLGGFLIATNVISMMTSPIITLVSYAVYSFVSPFPLTPELTFSSLALFQQLIMPLFVLPMTIAFTVNAIVSGRRLERYFVAPEIEENDDGRAALCSAEQQFKEGGDLGEDEDDLLDVEGNLVQAPSRSLSNSFKYERIPPDDVDFKSNLVTNGSTTGVYGTFHRDTSVTDFERTTSHSVPENTAVMITKGSYSWDTDNPVAILSDINLVIPAAKLTMLVGLVGSGKSSILSAILGEMTTLSGRVLFNRKKNRIAYTPQTAWLQNNTFKENILFGEPFNEKRYKQVLDACALQPDIDILPAGDLTEIGEKGINLSGGQKQRVSLARCMYSNTDIIIMDDPLAALDVHVGSHVMHEGILGFVMKEQRTVILVSHQLQYLQYAHKIIVVDSGRIYRQGNLDEITNDDPQLLGEWGKSMLLQSESEKESGTEEETTELERKELLKQVSMVPGEELKFEKGTTLIEDEESEHGSVSWRVYLAYAKAVKFPMVLAVLAIWTLQTSATVTNNFWLSAWSESGVNATLFNVTEDASDDLGYWIGGYALISTIAVILGLFGSSVQIMSALIAAKRIHIALLHNIIHAPMRFFDTTPVGRILNRFSNDTQMIDQKLMQTINRLLLIVFQVIAALVVNTVVVPMFLLFVMPVLIIYYFIQTYYIATSRELQRLDSITKSPVFAHFSETLGGLTTIRAYRHERRFRRNLFKKIDTNNIVFVFLQMVNRWLAVRLDLVGAFIVLISGLGALVMSALGNIQPSLVGLALTYSLQVSMYLNWLIRQTSELEMQMNAMERVEHYTHIPVEQYEGIYAPPPEWPDKGDVRFTDVCVRYSTDLGAVLRDVTVHFKAGEKIGVCGRTGSGKSSLALTLFRLVDTFKGSVVIDGIDISQVPLLTLRNRIAIIPQDPVLFAGTIRFNLDPLEQTADDKLWKALEIAQLKHTVSELDDQLDAEVAENGENFSLGQRQLFCLARAFLRNARILVMDEATASIDMQTDAILQEVVATSFNNVTVITIAHRVATIMDSDNILVLSDGKIVEYDTPENLLIDENSVFSSLIKGKN